MPKNYWMLADSLGNFRVTRDQGFTAQGINTRHRKKAQRMEPGDRLLYYLVDAHRFAATATVASASVGGHTPGHSGAKGGDDYPVRIDVKPEVVLEEATFLDARQLAPRMEYVRKWPPEQWHLAFQGMLHLIPKSDFLLIEEEMRKVTSRGSSVRRQARRTPMP